jgi:flagellar export protein FliJ
MRAFNFPLASIRLLRQQRERAAQQRYARALTICDGAERVLQIAEEELAASYAMLSDELTRATSISRLIHLRTWSAVLEIRLHECEAALQNARDAATETFNFLSAATRDRETLDRFHDKSRRTWERHCRLDEQKMLDELAVQRQPATGLEPNRLN